MRNDTPGQPRHVTNDTGKPERVLTNDQWQQLAGQTPETNDE